jgi:predicted lipoprotein
LLPAELAKNVILPVYKDLDGAAATLHTAAETLKATPTDAHLDAARKAWRAARKPWELSEAHLLGPVKDQDLDPQLDSWPLNRTDVDKVLAGQDALTADLIAKQPPSMKGFHAIEYILFGAGTGTQPKATDLTPRQLAYLTALTGDFRRVAADLTKAWAPEGGNYVAQFVPPANAKTVLAEVLTAMGEICEEVADAKIETPLAAKDRTLEESLFSNNSMEDFRHNLEGVQNVYLGRYATAGQGLSALVIAKDPALDARVRQQFANTLASMAAVTVPFGDAITSQAEQLRRVQSEFRTLRQLIGQEVTLHLLGQASADKT